MKRFKRWLTGPLTLLLLLALPAAAVAAGIPQDDPDPTVINSDITVNSDYDIDENTVVNGSVTILSGELDLAGTVNGDVTVFGGSVVMSGTVNGALVVIGGELELTDTATYSGACAVIGGTVQRAEGASGSPGCSTIVAGAFGQSLIDGLTQTLEDLGPQITLELDPITPPDFEAPVIEVPEIESPEIVPPAVPPIPDMPGMPDGIGHYDGDHGTSFFGRFLGVIGRSLLAGGLAFLIAVLLPQRLVEITDAVERKPAAAGTIGFFTAIAALSILALTSIIWVPILAILALICGLGILLALGGVAFMGATVVMGWTAVGVLVGERIASWLNIEKPGFATVATVGSTAITFGIGMLGLLPFTPDVLLGLAILSIGLGGVVLTRFGAQPYPIFIEQDDKVSRAIRNMPTE